MNRKQTKRFVLGFVVVLVVLSVGAVLFVLNSARAQTWVMQKVTKIANTYLEPTLAFDDFRLEGGRAVLAGASLVSDGGVRSVEVGTMELVLAEIPRRGEPIVIEELVLRRPRLNLVRDPETGGFKGLVPMVKSKEQTDQDKVDEDVKLSNVFQLRRVVLDDASIRYDAGDGSPVMEIDEISTVLKLSRSDTDGEDQEGGWYRVDFETGREPGLEVQAVGRFNIDTFALELDDSSVHVTVDEGTVGSLPPQVQSVVKQYQARGRLAASLSGLLKLTDMRGSDVSGRVLLEGFDVVVSDYRFPIDRLEVPVELHDGQLAVDAIDGALMGGQVRVTANGGVASPNGTLEAKWELTDVDLGQMAYTEAAKAKIAGLLSGSGNVTTVGGRPRESLSGRGTAKVRDGRLIFLPAVNQIAQLMDLAFQTGASHKADAEFELAPEGVRVTKSEIVTEVFAARGTGWVYFDQRLDMDVNAGPMEKVQSLLGPIGDALGKVTDMLVTYRVTGTVSEPTVKLKVGG